MSVKATSSITLLDTSVGRNNLLSDTNVPAMKKKAATGNKYLSDDNRSSYSTGAFVEVDDLLIPEFTHVYRFTCTTACPESTARRSLCFYGSTTPPMVDGQEYTMSMYARKTSGDGKIIMYVGYTSYPDSNKFINVTSEWARYSYTFTYSDSETGGTGGARAYFGASCAVVGVVETFGYKLEKGNKATNWCYSTDDNEYASKVATNYMKFENTGLTIGNMTNSTLGKNVLIDSDSVDIRNGTEVLASYGEEVVIRHKSADVFTIKMTDILKNIIDNGRIFTITAPSPSYGGTITFRTDAYLLTSSTDYVLKVEYKDDNDDEYFIFSSYDNVTIYGFDWSPSTKSIISIILDTATLENKTLPCVYYDTSSISELLIKGRVVIQNSSDVSGSNKCLPPLSIGVPTNIHLEIDGNEIAAKTNETTTGDLNLNSDGGKLLINTDCDRRFMFNDGKLYAMNNTVAANNWFSIIDGVNSSGNTAFSYGNYYNEKGYTNYYGNNIQLISKKNIALNPSSYITSSRNLKVLWIGSGTWYMNQNNTASLNESITSQLNGIVLVWSEYTTKVQNAGWNFTFIPKIYGSNSVIKGSPIEIILTSFGQIGYKSVYINNTTIIGSSINDDSSYTINGITTNPNKFVLRYIYGV